MECGGLEGVTFLLTVFPVSLIAAPPAGSIPEEGPPSAIRSPPRHTAAAATSFAASPPGVGPPSPECAPPRGQWAAYATRVVGGDFARRELRDALGVASARCFVCTGLPHVRCFAQHFYCFWALVHPLPPYPRS